MTPGGQYTVVVQFARGEQPVEVVPAFWVRPGIDNYPVYNIADGAGGWMETSPELHNKFIGEKDRASGGKLKYVVQIVKAWCMSRSEPLPLNSFHLELLLADSDGVCQVGKSYAECTRDAFALLARRECRALRDPKHCAGLVPAAATEAKREALQAAVAAAAKNAGAAVLAETHGDTRSAFKLWNAAFNNKLF